MDIPLVSQFLLRCLILNYLIMLWWFAAFVFGHRWLYQLHSRWFPMSQEQFDKIHYVALTAFKIGIILFNLVPLIAVLGLG